jgi:lipopolysaccharide transport system ATP-binding protein
MTPIIQVENLSKQYRLGQVGTGTLKDDLKRWWHRMRGKEDPFLTIGESNDRSQKGNSEYVWALRDINFCVQPGEVLGIIGRNGAGKSTLLKILSRVTEPTTGRISMRGRVASLLEVGTGFHPDLTGRENIYLNGAILGMTKKEITRKFDEIVEFAGVERYIDTPVKRYSSGMHVRLGFAVAAHLEPEILIVDEVLAVGDAEFQKKCLGKMKSVSSNEGRTVLFVSHNLTAVRSLCNMGLVLANGGFQFFGNAPAAIENYLQTGNTESHRQWAWEDAPGSAEARLTAVFIRGANEVFFIDEPLTLCFEAMLGEGLKLPAEFNFSLVLGTVEESVVFNVGSEPRYVQKRHLRASCTIPANLLNDETYTVRILLVKDRSVPLFDVPHAMTFKMQERDRDSNWHGKWIGMTRPQQLVSWTMES